MISAIILAAGQSRRMGQPKMLLPWGKTTVVEHVISVFAAADIESILVVTGGAHEQVEHAIANSRAHPRVRIVYNQDYLHGEMLSSLKCGLRALMATETAATLVGLGDQPQVQEGIVRLACEAFRQTKSLLVVPSFQMRRGHPWLAARPLWEEILDTHPPKSARDFLIKHGDAIHYVNVETPSILADLDTPEDYQKSHP